MKIKLFGSLLIIFSAFVLVVSCVSEPPEAQEDSGALNSASQRAAKAKQLGEDFHAPGYFPSEWESAISLYTEAESSKSAAAFNAAADALEAVAAKAVAQFAADQGAELLNARNRAVQAGAEELAEDYLLQADNEAAKVKPLYDAKDYYAARDATFFARDMYESIETGLIADNLRVDLEERGFARYDPEVIGAIDDTYISGIEDFEKGDIKSARSKAEKVLEGYIEYQSKWMHAYIADAADNAAAERQRALDVKANIAVRFDFDTADVLYTRAQDARLDERIEEAANLFDRSRSMFASASRLTLQKRDLAEEALTEADSRMIQSDETAQRAETLLEGGGI